MTVIQSRTRMVLMDLKSQILGFPTSHSELKKPLGSDVKRLLLVAMSYNFLDTKESNFTEDFSLTTINIQKSYARVKSDYIELTAKKEKKRKEAETTVVHLPLASAQC